MKWGKHPQPVQQNSEAPQGRISLKTMIMGNCNEGPFGK